MIPPTSTTLPTPPFIDLPSLRNLRDAGGYPVAGGQPQRIVRRGILYRSSEPSMVTDADAAAVLSGALGIRTVYDLRSQTEIDRDAAAGKGRQVREWDGARRVFAPVFAAEDYSPEAVARRFSSFGREGSEGFAKVYKRILEAAIAPDGAQPFATILRHLAQPDPHPILVHCTAGKDRTGVLVALVLSLCGVADAAVAHEYSLTDLGLMERKLEFIAHLVRSPPLEGDRPAAVRMVSSRAESMVATLDLVRREWGGVEEFVKRGCGLSDAEVDAIRRNLVVEPRAGGDVIDWEAHRELVLEAQKQIV